MDRAGFGRGESAVTRFENWPTLLAFYVDSRRSEPFAWGSNDCCLFAADWVLIATGHDIAASFRGTYSGPLEATRIIREAGGIENLLATHAPDLRRISAKQAGRGDLVLRAFRNGPTLGINLGGFDCFVAKEGLAFVPLDETATCWRL